MQKKQNNRQSGKAIFPAVLGILIVLIVAAAILLVQVLERKSELDAQFQTETETLTAETEEIEIYLPETYYAATGLTMEIYNSQVTDLKGSISKYNVRWTCDIGENLERKYSVTTTEEMIGNHELKIEIYDNAMNLLEEKSCILKVVSGETENRQELLKMSELITEEEAYLIQSEISIDQEYFAETGEAQKEDIIYSILCAMKQ